MFEFVEQYDNEKKHSTTKQYSAAVHDASGEVKKRDAERRMRENGTYQEVPIA